MWIRIRIRNTGFLAGTPAELLQDVVNRLQGLYVALVYAVHAYQGV